MAHYKRCRSKTPHLMTLVDVKPLKKRRSAIGMLDHPLVQLSHTTEWIVETLRKSDSNAFPINNLNWLIGRPHDTASQNLRMQCSEVQAQSVYRQS